MKLLLGFDADVADWVGRRIKHVGSGPGFGPCAAIGVVNDEVTEILGGVVYHNFRAEYRNCELSFASSGKAWLNRDMIAGLLGYPFDQLNCKVVIGVTPKHNRRALEFLRRFGFTRDGCVRSGFGSDDAIISTLKASEWRRSKFNRKAKAHGQENAASAYAA